MKTPETIMREALANLNLPLEELERIPDALQRASHLMQRLDNAAPCPKCRRFFCRHPENKTAAQARFFIEAATDADIGAKQ